MFFVAAKLCPSLSKSTKSSPPDAVRDSVVMLHPQAGEKRVCDRLYPGFFERRDGSESSPSSRKEAQNETCQGTEMGKIGLNKVMLIGNLGRDPEQKFLRNGGSVCTFSLGTPESYTKDGEQNERTGWHNVVFFGKLAEIAGEYLSNPQRQRLRGVRIERLREGES
jgi:hypothetical protein